MDSKFRVVLEYIGDRDVSRQTICGAPKTSFGRWIAFHEGEVVGIGLTARDAIKAAKHIGAEDPVLGLVVPGRDWGVSKHV